MMFIYKTRQTIHDVISNTMVVCNRFSEQDKVSDSEIILISYDDGIEEENEIEKGE